MKFKEFLKTPEGMVAIVMTMVTIAVVAQWFMLGFLFGKLN